MPLAAYATLNGDVLQLRATWGDPDGVHPLVQVRDQAQVLDANAAVALGEHVARALQSAVDVQQR